MEFLSYKATVAELRPSGLVEVPVAPPHGTPDEAGDLLRLTLEANGKTIKTVHRAAIGAEAALRRCEGVDPSTAIDNAPDALPQLAEDLLHKHKVHEALVIPVGKWRAVCDLLAFELAGDESWQDIDTEAALHLNSRDPLLLTPRDFHILPTMLGALARATPDDETGEHDLSIVAAGVGMILEFRPSGALVLTSANPSFCAELAAMV